MILTPGSKKRLLDRLAELTARVENGNERETIMWYAAQIMPTIVSELNYYDPAVEKPKEKHSKLPPLKPTKQKAPKRNS